MINCKIFYLILIMNFGYTIVLDINILKYLSNKFSYKE